MLRVPRAPEGRLNRRELELYLTHVPGSYAAVRLGRYDIAHAWFAPDAKVAARWKGRTGRPAIFTYLGIPDHIGLMDRRRRLQLTLDAVRGCDVTVALGEYAASQFQRWLGMDVPVIPPPVDIEQFRPRGERTEHPTVICAASVETASKRVPMLVRAFARVRRAHPEARLWINRPRDPHLRAALDDPERGVELIDLDDRDELARRYARAWVSALPSVGEAFGLVLAEALACGTPGVGTDMAGIPEVLNGPEIGRLFSENEDDLARALLETIELARDPSTATACRARACELSTERCTDAYESLYRDVLARG